MFCSAVKVTQSENYFFIVKQTSANLNHIVTKDRSIDRSIKDDRTGDRDIICMYVM